LLTDDFQMPDLLRQRLKMDAETFDKSVEKLAAQGAAVTDLAGNVRRAGNASWQSGYERQVEFRRTQIDRMMAFAETQQCRMIALIRHFGDLADAHKPCGRCDFCAPDQTTAQTFGEPTASETKNLRAILRELDGGSRSTGKLFTELAFTKDRKQFDALLDGLARAGLIVFVTDSFTGSEGKVISYRKASLTHEGKTLGEGDALGVVLQTAGEEAPPAKRRKDKRGSKVSSLAEDVSLTLDQRHLETKLRAWRKQEAAKTGKPAFIVFSDRALLALAVAAPRTLPELLKVSGFGPDKCDRYGAEICGICREKPALTAPETESGRSVQKPPPRQPVLPKVSIQMADTADEQDYRVPVSKQQEQRTVHPRTIASASELTSEQAAIEERLREWRTAESTRMGLPQFFVLATSALRSIVVAMPGNLSELRQIDGIGPDKLERFGPAILAAMRG
jgi:ATP-dependent DNA helicase RecQ